ncbi:unnamed protein product [Penicillium salamii]|uniref:SIMPL domain-containing protein n=1 Tax=Penicillium salamii TaxID=1612424 RepID=A0A9W4NX23_9EURO|nr:unnamed protein product [Penicillium salamii]CAG8147202.1 unnamed protein product [Penicillium salamii]CAG8152434.1 unnamed protein product [Penicillium salamii]CAG8244685.1 unnamed protein product [Penicillium salamii]CAG8332317.1 unnamed protein product [Penicillium salamii]
MAPLRITVGGSSAITRQPERGVLSVTVNGEGTTREIVSNKVTETSNELTKLFRELCPQAEDLGPTADAAVVSFSSTSLSTWRWKPYGEPTHFQNEVHRGNLSLVAVFRDFTKMSEVVGMLVGVPNVDINSIGWELTAATKKALSSQSRKEAIRDAVQKADDYSGVVGRKVAAVEIQDGGNSSFGLLQRRPAGLFGGNPGGNSGGLFGGRQDTGGPSSGSLFGRSTNPPAPAPDPPATLDLTPQCIQYTSSVQVIFESVDSA